MMKQQLDTFSPPPGKTARSAVQDPGPVEDARALHLLLVCGLALVVGIVTGLGAVVFRALISFVHNLLFLGHISIVHDSNLFTPPSPWGPWVILVPVIGGIGVTFIVSTFAPEAKGHGVPEVMDAIYYKRGVIRPIVAVAKSLASALSIGSGAAVGREGPIIQIGSALGSTLGQVIRMSMGQRIILVAAGAGAGIAATFNTPIGGVLFATELMLPEISVNTFLPVALATGTATFIGRLFFGARPAFDIPSNLASLPVTPGGALILLLYVALGVGIGVAAALFVRSLHWAEDLFDKVPGGYLRHAVGMLLVGTLMYALMRWGGHYYVGGVGYATIQATLAGQLTAAGFLLLLYVSKLLATSVSLGSGASGGIFSPSLFMGATLGGAFAALISAIFPDLPISVPAFAMVGMGAMVGSGTGAAMTAVAMVFEMTRDYANMFLVRSARDAMEPDFMLVDEATSFDEFLRLSEGATGMRHVVVTRGPLIVGVIRVNTDLRRTVSAAAHDVPMGALARRNFTIVRADAVVFDVIARLSRRRAVMGVVVDGQGRPRADKIIGVITKEHIADEVASSVRMYPR